MSKIRYYAITAKNAADRRNLTRMADSADSYAERLESMPEWARECAIAGLADVPVSKKIDHESLEVDHWVSKSGKQMHRVHWLDGTTTEYSGDLDVRTVAYDAHVSIDGRG